MTHFVIIASERDAASRNISNILISKFGFIDSGTKFGRNMIWNKGNLDLIILDDEITMIKGLDDYFSPNFYIFLSKHMSEKGVPALTAHFPGNFSKDNSFGGNPRELALTYPSLHKEYMKHINSFQDKVISYKIVIEPMHHGPTSLLKPVLFIELGSSETEWNDRVAGEAICNALLNTLREMKKAKKIGIGFGGTHYSEKFTKHIIESEFAIGAIAPKYALPHIDSQMVRFMIDRCDEEIRYAVLDWKGLGKEKERIVNLVTEAGLELVRI